MIKFEIVYSLDSGKTKTITTKSSKEKNAILKNMKCGRWREFYCVKSIKRLG